VSFSSIICSKVLKLTFLSIISRNPGRYIAVDCEMVGVGLNRVSSLARVSLVNYHGEVILDEYVKQRENVTDYRTPWSGIRKSDLINGMSLVVLDTIGIDNNSSIAKPFDEVQQRVNDLLRGRILIGHAVHHDLQVLVMSVFMRLKF
jgi:RNA exonuclease 4